MLLSGSESQTLTDGPEPECRLSESESATIGGCSGREYQVEQFQREKNHGLQR